ncbi:MAG: hypothetical protein ACX93I_07240 [Winogradskyella sp.]
MRSTFRTYLYLTLALLLGSMSSSFSYAWSSIDAYNINKNQHLLDANDGTFHYSRVSHTTDFKYYAEAPEVNESENEESSKTNSDSKIIYATAFINSLLFETFSKELEKSVFRSPHTTKKSRQKLFLEFQVFII